MKLEDAQRPFSAVFVPGSGAEVGMHRWYGDGGVRELGPGAVQGDAERAAHGALRGQGWHLRLFLSNLPLDLHALPTEPARVGDGRLLRGRARCESDVCEIPLT